MFADLERAPVSEPLRAALRFVRRLALDPDTVSPRDIEELRRAGLSDDAIRDCALVCALFSIIVRMADSLEFDIPDSFEASVAALTHKRGYSMPAPLFWLPRV